MRAGGALTPALRVLCAALPLAGNLAQMCVKLLKEFRGPAEELEEGDEDDDGGEDASGAGELLRLSSHKALGSAVCVCVCDSWRCPRAVCRRRRGRRRRPRRRAVCRGVG